ncbi:MAG: AraC family transcriptional regulator [Tannerella sp.]|jgi:AraC-like DNA-binding protein|nr:AraC family transcriptional regulator [Tannerella sp.]
MKKDVSIKYLIANEQDKRWGITVNTVGFQRIAPHAEYPPRNHPDEYFFSMHKGRILDEYVLLYISDGCGSFSSSAKENVKLKAGSMVLLFPGEWHSYAPDKSRGWEEYWIGFKGHEMDERVGNGIFDRQKNLFNTGCNPEIVKLYANAIHIALEQNAGYQQILSGIANLLLGMTYSLDKIAASDPKKITRQINRAKMIMFEHSHTNIRPEDIADKICMSYSWFRHIFKQQTGLSPNQYMQELRIRKSRELLVMTTLTCQEIAYKVGYENPIYFGVVFKRMTGYSPGKYREKYLQTIT